MYCECNDRNGSARVGDAAIDTTGERNVPFRSSGFQLNNTRPREKSYIGTFPLSSDGSIANQKPGDSGRIASDNCVSGVIVWGIFERSLCVV